LGTKWPSWRKHSFYAINQLGRRQPWKLRFSFGLALQDEVLQAWQGRSENIAVGQQAFAHRAECDCAAALGKYSKAMESGSADDTSQDRQNEAIDWRTLSSIIASRRGSGRQHDAVSMSQIGGHDGS
jgi:hypothetical protein